MTSISSNREGTIYFLSEHQKTISREERKWIIQFMIESESWQIWITEKSSHQKESLKILKGVIKRRKQKRERQRNRQRTMIYKILHRQLRTKQREPHKTTGNNLGAPERCTVPDPQVAPVVLLLLKIRW
jgi:hypothetical protein